MSLAELTETPGKVESLKRSLPYVEDPLAVYRQLCGSSSNNLLLESAEINSKHNLKSLLLIDAALKMTCWGDKVTINALSDNGRSLLPLFKDNLDSVASISGDEKELVCIFPQTDSNLDEASRLQAPSQFDSIRVLLKELESIRQEAFAVFLGGVFAYDYIANFERLPDVPVAENTCPDFQFYLAETLLVIDHQTSSSELIGNVFSGNHVSHSYFSISKRLEQLISEANNLKPYQVTLSTKDNNIQVDQSDEFFSEQVEKLKHNIEIGDVFQVVPSRTFSLNCENSLDGYAQLKQFNPSPYMFYMKDEDFTLFGASPESALKYCTTSNEVEVYPIAGTRPRGKNANGELNPDLDSRIELNLRNDKKETAEHLMLVDLARNDIARVSLPNTRHVVDLLKVDRYSHVMHLVSRVVGKLDDNLDALHAYQACMNMGTLVGAPKIRAAELIRQTEKKRRGSYGGAVGYITGDGDMDTCIVIRSAFVRNGIAHVQAGAGVVYDSVPQAEADETRSKAQAVITAIQSLHGEHG